MKKLSVGIFNPYLDTFGGGEKDVCLMAQALSEHYMTDIISIIDVPKKDLEEKFNVNLGNVNIRVLPYFPDICYSFAGLRYLSNLLYYWRISKGYDLFVNLVNFFPYPSFARKGVLRVQFPFNSKPFYKNLQSYDICMANSYYTKHWLKIRWKTDAEVIYPPVDRFSPGQMENIVLSVGRFFAGGHNKKHIAMISAFKKLCDEGLQDWEYHLIGSTKKGEEHEEYVANVKDAAHGYPIQFHFDAPFQTLKDYYARSKIFLHAAGYGEDESISPEKNEHFGITTVEAMSAGCVPLVYGAGGQLEIVSQGVNGYLWNTLDELASYFRAVVEDDAVRNRLALAAIKDSGAYDRERYRREILDMAGRVMGD